MRRAKLRSSSPVPTSKARAMATCVATNACLARICPRRPSSRVPATNASLARTPDSVQAGTIPTPMPVRTEIARANASTGRSTSRLTWGGSHEAASASNASTAYRQNNRPRTPPAIESIKASVRTCHTTRRRPAPSATLTAISRSLAETRASISVATFTHTRRRTNPTVVNNNKMLERTPPTTCSWSERTSAPTPSFHSGYSSSSLTASEPISWSARSTPMPSRSLATTTEL